MNKIRNKKGVTLIALITTIVLILILSAIALASMIGENGLITRSSINRYCRL